MLTRWFRHYFLPSTLDKNSAIAALLPMLLLSLISMYPLRQDITLRARICLPDLPVSRAGDTFHAQQCDAGGKHGFGRDTDRRDPCGKFIRPAQVIDTDSARSHRSPRGSECHQGRRPSRDWTWESFLCKSSKIFSVTASFN